MQLSDLTNSAASPQSASDIMNNTGASFGSKLLPKDQTNKITGLEQKAEILRNKLKQTNSKLKQSTDLKDYAELSELVDEYNEVADNSEKD